MATISFGGGVTGIRGKLGGSIFCANGSGAYVHAFRKPLSHTSLAQADIRWRMAMIRATWSALSDSLRADWDTWSHLPAQARINSLGVTYYLSGWQAFVGLNLSLFCANITPRSIVPTKAVPSSPTIYSISWIKSGASMDFLVAIEESEFTSSDSIIIRASYDPYGTTSVPRAWWHQIYNYEGVPASPLECAPWVRPWCPAPATGSAMWTRCYIMDEFGQRSTPTLSKSFWSAS
jgi:hypothetical protein